MSEHIRTKYRRFMTGANRKPSRGSDDKPTEGHKCPKCGRKLKPKMELELHYQLEPDCNDEAR